MKFIDRSAGQLLVESDVFGFMFMVQPVITLVELSHLPRKDTASTSEIRGLPSDMIYKWWLSMLAVMLAVMLVDEGHTSTVCQELRSLKNGVPKMTGKS